LRDQLMSRLALVLGDSQVHREAELQAIALRAPGEPQLVVLPVAGKAEREVAVLSTIERQVFRGQDMFDDVQGIIAQEDGVVRLGGVHKTPFAAGWGRTIAPESPAILKLICFARM